MKRDLDLSRQLLLDIENRGADCSVSVLRTGPNHDAEERVRYHLRLLIDAGLLKEVDRTSAGVPCVRLTHDGHELLELARSESLWREAKWICQERLGGQSLSVMRNILLRLAMGPQAWAPRTRRTYVTRRPRHAHDADLYRVEPYRVLSSLDEHDPLDEGHVRYVRVRPETDAVEERPVRYGVDVDGDRRIDLEYEASFPADLF